MQIPFSRVNHIPDCFKLIWPCIVYVLSSNDDMCSKPSCHLTRAQTTVTKVNRWIDYWSHNVKGVGKNIFQETLV